MSRAGADWRPWGISAVIMSISSVKRALRQIGPVAAVAILPLIAGCPGTTGAPRPGTSNQNAPEPVDPNAGVITTVAGTGLASFTGDGRPATESGLYSPLDVAFRPDGTPLILDWNNQRIRELLPDGTLLTVVGTGFEGVSEPGILAIGFPLHHCLELFVTGDGQMFLAGYHDPRVLRVDLDERVQVVAGTGEAGNAGDNGPADQALLDYPSGVAVSSDGTVYVADQNNHNIRRIEPDGTIRRFAGTGSAGYSGDGGPALNAELRGPTRIVLDGTGNLLVCDTSNHAIRQIDASGMIRTIAGTGTRGYSGDGGPATQALLYSPYDLQPLPDGTLLIADSLNHVVRHVDREGTIRTIIGSGEGGFSGDGGVAREAEVDTPSGLALDSAGNLWIADTGNHRIRRVQAGFLLTAP
jgi:sugar lactone lactonase YvrE